MKHILKKIFLLSCCMVHQSILPMHRHLLKKSIGNVTFQQRSFCDQPIEYMQALHVAALAINSYGLARVKAPESIPAHCAGIVLGVSASTPEAVIGVVAVTSFAYINNYNKYNNKK